jgi:uncharacterized membrane protein YfcA
VIMGVYLWVSLVPFLAGFNQGLSGFGVILIAIPLLTLFLNIKTVISLMAFTALAKAIMPFIQLRDSFDFSKILPFLMGAVPGIPIGVFILKHVDKAVIQWILGLILLFYSIYSLVIKKPPNRCRSKMLLIFSACWSLYTFRCVTRE